MPSHSSRSTTSVLSSKEMTIAALVALYLFTISRRSLLSSFNLLVSSTKMEAKLTSSTLRILVHGGDNMLGRAVQLSLPVQAAGEELIRDSCTALHYLDMCLNHPSGRQDDPTLEAIREMNARQGSYLWGDYQGMIITPPPDLKLLNVETAVTTSIHNKDLPQWKGIRYHMHSANYGNVMSGFRQETHGGERAAPVVVNFANNHAMDYGRQALEEESIPLLKSLQSDDFQAVGVGMNLKEASKPATVNCASTPVQVFAFSSGCSGTPPDWWATEKRSGLVGLPSLYSKKDVDAAMKIASASFDRSPKPASGLRIVSIHWGPNWAMKGENEEELASRRRFTHRLIDECSVDMLYGHSSHHARGIEVYNGKLILYGTGDIINDYEGFENPGEEMYNRLGGIYVVDLDRTSGEFQQLHVIPMYMNRLRLDRFTPASRIWQPNRRALVHNPNKSVEFCDFINKLSLFDAGGKKNALMLEHVESDPQIPGGPILRSSIH